MNFASIHTTLLVYSTIALSDPRCIFMHYIIWRRTRNMPNLCDTNRKLQSKRTGGQKLPSWKCRNWILSSKNRFVWIPLVTVRSLSFSHWLQSPLAVWSLEKDSLSATESLFPEAKSSAPLSSLPIRTTTFTPTAKSLMAFGSVGWGNKRVRARSITPPIHRLNLWHLDTVSMRGSLPVCSWLIAAPGDFLQLTRSNWCLHTNYCISIWKPRMERGLQIRNCTTWSFRIRRLRFYIVGEKEEIMHLFNEKRLKSLDWNASKKKTSKPGSTNDVDDSNSSRIYLSIYI